MPSAEASSWLLRNVEIDGARQDCRLSSGTITELGHLQPANQAETVLDGRGGALLPGLADHHVHLFATAATSNSLDLQGRLSMDAVMVPEGSGWLRITGVGTELNRTDLDAWLGTRPVRAQHRSGALWTLNTAAVELVGGELTEAERRSGQLWRADTRLRRVLAEAGQSDTPQLADLGRELASLGITHVTDATADLDRAGLQLLDAELPQRLLSLAEVGSGPRKIIIADSGLPDLTSLSETIRVSHERGRPVAIHAVSAVGLAITIAALSSAGTIVGDRVEHAAVCDDSAADALASLGVTVVTQPTIFARHGVRFTQESPAYERPFLWRYRSLLRAGVPVAVSSDAPYGDVNPWRTISAAATRPDEAVEARIALSSMLSAPRDPAGPARRVAPGEAADLCLLKLPLAVTLNAVDRLANSAVRATFVAGRLVFLSPDSDSPDSDSPDSDSPDSDSPDSSP
ncbi:amidohydrolase family protein [Jatrophihabitans sp. DSM 45814]